MNSSNCSKGLEQEEQRCCWDRGVEISGNLGITSQLVCGKEELGAVALVCLSLLSFCRCIARLVCFKGIIANNGASGSHLLSAAATATDPRVRVGGDREQ